MVELCARVFRCRHAEKNVHFSLIVLLHTKIVQYADEFGLFDGTKCLLLVVQIDHGNIVLHIGLVKVAPVD